MIIILNPNNDIEEKLANFFGNYENINNLASVIDKQKEEGRAILLDPILDNTGFIPVGQLVLPIFDNSTINDLFTGGQGITIMSHDSNASSLVYNQGPQTISSSHGGVMLVTPELKQQSPESLSSAIYTVGFPGKYFLLTNNPIIGKSVSYTDSSYYPAENIYWE